MNIEKLEDVKIIDDVIFAKGKNGDVIINLSYDENGCLIGGFFEQFYGKYNAKISFDKNSEIFSQILKIYNEHKIKEEKCQFIKDCLLREEIVDDHPIVEIESSLEDSISMRLVKSGQANEVVLVSSLLSYSDCKKIGFTKVIAGEVLTGNRTIWVCEDNLKDRKSVEHPDLNWALDKKNNLTFGKSTLLCLSRRKDLRKIVGQFNRAFIGYYGVENSDIIKWREDFYEKELGKFINEFETIEKGTTLSDDSKFVLRLFMKK